MYNKVIMIGRLTVQPELVTTPNDKSVDLNRKMGNVMRILFPLWFGDVWQKP